MNCEHSCPSCNRTLLIDGLFELIAKAIKTDTSWPTFKNFIEDATIPELMKTYEEMFDEALNRKVLGK